MRFYVPTDIYVEKDCVKSHAPNLLAVGKRAFIMTGKTSAKKNGSLNDVIKWIRSILIAEHNLPKTSRAKILSDLRQIMMFWVSACQPKPNGCLSPIPVLTISTEASRNG